MTKKADERLTPLSGPHNAAPNIVETALRAGEQLSRVPFIPPGDDMKPVIILKDANGNETAQVLEARFETPPRKKGLVKLHDGPSFLEYWTRQRTDGSAIYGNLKPAQFLAVFDDHTTAPAYRGHRALFLLTHSTEWTTWKDQSGVQFKGNEEFGEWLENQIPDIANDPVPGAKLLEIALNMRVQSNASFGNRARLANGHLEFQYTNNVEGQAAVGPDTIAIPEEFAIDIPVWSGIDPKKYRIDVRFRYRLNSGRLTIWYELVRPHKVLEQAFKDVLDVIEAGANTTVLFGTPE